MRSGRTYHAIVVGIVAGVVGAATGDVIDFDDLMGAGVVPDGYGTVEEWNGWVYFRLSMPPYNPHSPPSRIYKSSLGTGEIRFGRGIVFEGAWFAGHGTSRGLLPISFSLYLDDQLVHTSGQIDLVSDGVPTWLASGFSGLVDTVVVNGSHGYYVMDDLTFFEAGSVRLSATGDCPGRVTVAWAGAGPGRPQGIAVANTVGRFIVPGGPCGGTQLGLSNQGIQLVYTGNTGPNGSGQVSSNVGAAGCGKYIQMVVADGSPCATSNVVQLP